MTLRSFFLAALGCSLTLPAMADEARLLRFPATNGQDLVLPSGEIRAKVS